MAPKFLVLVRRNSNGFKKSLKKYFSTRIPGIHFTDVMQIFKAEKGVLQHIFIYID